MKKRICAAALCLSLCASTALSAAALDVEKARELLAEHYISPLPAAAEQAQTLDELFSALNDPYTVYYTAEEYTDFLESVNGETLIGIGVAVQNAFDNGFAIMSVLPDSPALEAGLKAGDVLIAVNGVALTAQDNITALLTGEEGTGVTVTVRRAGGVTADFTMERRVVRLPIITYDDLGHVGWFDCSSFGDSTPDGVFFPVASMPEDIKLWVMDLRSNPGGASDSAAMTATHFTGGNIMVYYRNGNGEYYVTQTHPLNKDWTDAPLILLTGPSTASAAELFSGAIRDYRSGIAIGQRTYGKGIAQIALDENNYPDIFQGDCLKLTAFQFFSPSGLTSHLIGVLPSLLLAEEDVPAVLALLTSPAPVRAQGWLKLELAGQSFYLEPQACHDDPETFGKLLAAIPPAAMLYRGYDRDDWEEITPAAAAQWRGANYQQRTFSDVADSPYRTAIDTLACYDLIAGNGAGAFLPENTLTRGELCAMLANAFQLSDGGTIPFSDVSPDAWYAPAISAMAARGFVAGTDAGTFLPDAPVTNQELYTILSSISTWVSTKGYEQAEKTFTAYQWLDFYNYPEWAQESARNLRELGVTVDNENPTVPVTRGSFAQALFELMTSLGMFWY